jgi:sigma-B regulation protein RsbU (phosphoserine phosphatase)
MAASLVIRIGSGKDIAGLLFVGPPSDGTPFEATQRRLLRGAATPLAMMIENARLTERIVEQERLRRELQLAGEVQQRLFPLTNPETAKLQLAGFCVPARGVGGDYYDFLNVGPNRTGVALADVAGKGIAAALIMSIVQASLRSLVGGSLTIPQIVAQMNRLLYRSTGPQSYATFFYAEADESNSTLTYVNGGHNPPYLLRGDSFLELTQGGAIIGMFPELPYDQGSVGLESDDILILFSDGVPEAQNPAGDEFGEDRLKQIVLQNRHLSVTDASAEVLGALKAWIQDAAQYDDMTLVLMRVR